MIRYFSIGTSYLMLLLINILSGFQFCVVRIRHYCGSNAAGKPQVQHENALVRAGDLFILIGGRDETGGIYNTQN